MAKKFKELETQISYDTPRMKAIGSRYTSSTTDVEFVRDVDTLFSQYKPLRLRIYGELSNHLRNASDKEELTGFINEHFVRLVKEYDPSTEVDFPGYIAIMLPMRARYSFMNSLKRVYTREDTSEADDEVLSYLETLSMDVPSDELEEVLMYIYKSVHVDEIEGSVIAGFIEGLTPTMIERRIRDEYNMEIADARERVQDVKEAMKAILTKYINE